MIYFVCLMMPQLSPRDRTCVTACPDCLFLVAGLTCRLDCRDNGGRQDRQKSRLMWLVEEWGVDKFREAIAERMGEPLSHGVRAQNPKP